MKYADLPGLALPLAIGLAAAALANTHLMQHWQLSSLTLAILLGMAVGNLGQSVIPDPWKPGIQFAQSRLLRLGIVLYGFRLSFQQVADVGLSGLLVDFAIVATTFIGGYWIGTRWLKIDRETTMLTAAGASICGAAAVLATEPVVRGKPHQTAMAVATVVLFGTLGMFLYPVLQNLLHWPDRLMGIYTGATIHEVAQVVAAGNAMSGAVVDVAVITKLTRVLMLAPFLIVLSLFLQRRDARQEGKRFTITIPWFAVLFVVMVGVNSLAIVPATVMPTINGFDNLVLAVAMAALGLESHIGKLRGVGPRPLLLALALFVWLVIGGFGLTEAVNALVG
ncbi:MAG: YeiH family putative sulfate export transporter [Candidatus Competibacteraceae bacterium]|nr:MAG: YeiH family putative sulfate export transporter [Candidatus Competibacteraceae bacterium]